MLGINPERVVAAALDRLEIALASPAPALT